MIMRVLCLAIAAVSQAWSQQPRVLELTKEWQEPRMADMTPIMDARFADDGSIVVASRRSIWLVDLRGQRRELRKLSSGVQQSVAAWRDTVAVIVSNDQPQITFLSGRNGRELFTRDLPYQRGEHLRLLGRGDAGWIVEFERSVVPAGRMLDPADVLTRRYVAIGNSREVEVAVREMAAVDLRHRQGSGTVALFSPFAPRPAGAVAAGGPLYVTSSRWGEIERLAGNQAPIRFVADTVPKPSPALHARWIDSWVAANRDKAPEAALRELVRRDSSQLGLGQIFASSAGELLVQRRDLDPDPITMGDSTVFDLLGVNGRALGRLSVPPWNSVLAFDGSRLLSVARFRQPGDGAFVEQLIVYRVERSKP